MRFQDGVATELQGSRASVESRTLVEGRSSVEGRTSLEDSRTSAEMGRIAAEGCRSSAENSKAAPQYFVFPLWDNRLGHRSGLAFRSSCWARQHELECHLAGIVPYDTGRPLAAGLLVGGTERAVPQSCWY